MGAVFIYWVLLLAIFLPIGTLGNKLLQLNHKNLTLNVLTGIVFTTAGFTITAFFSNLGLLSFIGCTLLSVTTGYIFRQEIKNSLNDFVSNLKLLPFYLKAAIVLLFAGALLKSAQFPFAIDNESYYLQTIKWINEYGIVRGLANLHIFLAQNSSWHILQAGLNLNFITDRINDINGFFFIVCSFYYITESNKANTEGKPYYWLGFMPVFSILLFQFIPAPSPDIPCLLLTPIILHLYITSTNEDNKNIKQAFLLFIFLIIIKITIIPIGIIFLPSLRKKGLLLYMTKVSLPFLVLWCAKNLITSGYPLYPLSYFKVSAKWAIPHELFKFMITINANDGYYDNVTAPAVNTMYTKLSSWASREGIEGIINKVTLVLTAALPLLPGLVREKKMRLIYLGLFLNFTILLLTSPQFRYFLHVTICLTLFAFAWFFTTLKAEIKLYKTTIWASVLAVFLLFLNIPLGYLTKNKFHQSTDCFSTEQLLWPEASTKFPEMQFTREHLGNLNYYSPAHNFLLYGTADGPLPCVNKRQVEYYKNTLGIYPQLIDSTDIGKGFYSKTEVPQ